MKFTTIANAKKLTGLSYIGMVNNSTKHVKAYMYNEMVYTIYLAPAASSGYEVCPGRTAECTLLCLNESGRNKMKTEKQVIANARAKKTQLFFEHKEFFVNWVFHEIKLAKANAEKNNFRFSVRLNNTSDISPEDFFTTIDGKQINILEYFNDVQFYDYTKVPSRFELTKKYSNYDLTFSFSGSNKFDCLQMLKNNVRVAVVFKTVPDAFWGFPVIDGDKYDMRYLDDKNCIVGLKFKQVRNKLDAKYKFVIQD
jgi:hypothetical protein